MILHERNFSHMLYHVNFAILTWKKKHDESGTR